MRVAIMMSLLVIPLLAGCEAPPQEAAVEIPTAKAPPADPASVTAQAPTQTPTQAPRTGLLDADVPSQLQTATFALG